MSYCVQFGTEKMYLDPVGFGYVLFYKGDSVGFYFNLKHALETLLNHAQLKRIVFYYFPLS